MFFDKHYLLAAETHRYIIFQEIKLGMSYAASFVEALVCYQIVGVLADSVNGPNPVTESQKPS